MKKLDVPYELPDGWEWAKLGSYMDVRDGTHDTPKYFDSGIPFVTSKNLGDGKIDFKNVNYISDEDSQKFNQRSRVKAGDILMAMIGTIGKPVVAPKVEFEYSIKNVALFKRLTIEQNSKFIRDYLQYSEKRLRKCASGGNQKFLSLKKLKEILIPIPPSSEQKQIVSVLSDYLSLVECIDSDQNALQQLASQLKQKVLDIAMQGKLVPQDPNDEPASVLLEKIRAEKQRLYEEGKIKKKDLVETEIVKDGDNAYYEKVGNKENKTPRKYVYDIPESWRWKKLGELILSNIGLTYKPTDIDISGVPVLRANNIKNGSLNSSDLVYVNQETRIKDNEYLNTNDVLVAVRSGSKALVGKAALVTEKYDGYSFGAFMSVIRPGLLNSTFMLNYLESNLFRTQLDDANTTTIYQVTQKMLKNAFIPIPPLNEMERIVNITEKFSELQNRFEV